MDSKTRKDRKTGAQYIQSVQLGRELYTKTKKTAAAKNISMAQVIRDALDQYHNQDDDWEMLLRSLRRSDKRRDEIGNNVDLSIEILLLFVQKFYHFFEAWDQEHGDNGFNKETKFNDFIDEIIDTKVRKGLFSERIDHEIHRRFNEER